MSFAIQNLEGQLFGFLLMTNKGSFGECIVRLLPKKSNTFLTEGSDILQKLQTIGKVKYIYFNGQIIIRHTELSEAIIIENNLFTVSEQQYQVVELKGAFNHLHQTL